MTDSGRQSQTVTDSDSMADEDVHAHLAAADADGDTTTEVAAHSEERGKVAPLASAPLALILEVVQRARAEDHEPHLPVEGVRRCEKV